ncbi:MAG: hypothetical protein HZB75_04940 [Candidatus Saccharibacteria bacterium]|jgi:hypothetical protein|nr:MAG: hypothetical protein HZB75_04940 [Candidatus Saccharibacteria bacterium]
MDIQPTNQQPISDDQELAKVLAGVNQQAEEAAATPVTSDVPAEPLATPAPAVDEPEPAMAMPTMPDPVMAQPAMPTMPAMSGDLESIKKDALSELRPLVDKLNVAPEEKFDTYLLLLRSTDDQALIGPAHEAARNITDEARRAQALLDIIKEIDYLSNPQQPTA